MTRSMKMAHQTIHISWWLGNFLHLLAVACSLMHYFLDHIETPNHVVSDLDP